MIGKKINQLATELAPASTDLTIIGNPTTGVSKKITLAQLGAIFSGAVSFYTNYASFPATGTLDVIFCAKDTKKLYLWSGSAYVEVFPSQALLDTYQLRSEKGNANGYASLDSSGKVPVSQLPSSIMEYKGTWSAATNTPTLANGTGDTGDVYICNAAGSVNFGAGSITFAVGDYVIYSGSIWQRSSGAVGTVTSVAASITGNAIGITGSPVTTSGTLAFAFAGTGAQYIKGDGTLATFPTTIEQAKNLITEVYNSTGATLTKGTVVYINGGQGNLPTVTKALATGDSTSAQTYGIVQADITNMNNGYVVVAGRLLDIDTQAYSVGTQLYLSSTTAGAYTSTKQYAPAHLVYVGIVVRAHPTQGVIEVKIQNGYELDELHNVAAQTPTNNDGLFWEASTSLWKNKSLATIIGGTPVFGSGTQNRLARWSSTSGELINSGIQDTGGSITNVLTTAGQYAWQFNGSTSTGLSYGALIVAGTNASDVSFKIMNASATSAYLYMWGDGRLQVNNIPNATTDTDRFLVSDSGIIKYRTGTELLSDIGGQPAGTYVTSVGLSVPTGFAVSGSPVTSSGTLALSFDTGYSLPTIAKQNNWDTAYNTRIVTASSPLSFISNTISISQASGSTSGYLSSTDWTTFNNKQSALTNPVTGTGTTNYLPKFTGTSTIGNSVIQEVSGNILIGNNTASATTTPVYLSLGGTYGTTLANGIKIKLFESGGVYHGLGVIAGNLYLNTTDASTYITLNTNNTERLRIDTSGNLGLGVTPSAWGSLFSGGVLQVKNASLLGYSNNTYLSANAYFTNSSDNYIASDFATRYVQASGQHRWEIAPSGTAGNAISFTQAMTLDASGRLGVGTTSLNNLITFNQTIGGSPANLSELEPYATVKIKGRPDRNNIVYVGAIDALTGMLIQSGTTSTAANLAINPFGGSVGIGTTSPASGFNLTLENNGANLRLRNTTTRYRADFAMQTAQLNINSYDDTAGAYMPIQLDASKTILGTQGNVGIGTTSPLQRLHVYNSSSSTVAIFQGPTNSYIQLGTSSESYIGNVSGALTFEAGGSERMRITSGGALLLNGTTQGDGVLQVFFNDAASSPFNYGARIVAGRTNSSVSIAFSNPNGVVGSIQTSGSVTTYNVTSDYRLKQDYKDFSGLDLVTKIKTYDYEWKADKTRNYGVIAHELQSVINYAVTGVKDGEQMQGVDYSKIVPVLIKAIQEQQAQIEQLKNK